MLLSLSPSSPFSASSPYLSLTAAAIYRQHMRRNDRLQMHARFDSSSPRFFASYFAAKSLLILSDSPPDSAPSSSRFIVYADCVKEKLSDGRSQVPTRPSQLQAERGKDEPSSMR